MDELIESKWYMVAKHAYMAYGATTHNKNYQGLPMPLFDDLTPLIKQAWINAVMDAVAYTNSSKA